MKLDWLKAIATALLCAGVAAHAQTYPARELNVVAGLPAGSGGDGNAGITPISSPSCPASR